MKQRVFFQSSLPRAGSTLLQNIIGQNNTFHVTPTSGMIDLILGARIGYNQNKESKAGDLTMWKEGFYSFCKGGLYSYVSNLTDKPYILDKNRAWGSYYSLMSNIVENPKVIFMIRDLRAIYASMEKKFRENPDYDDGMLNNATLANITTQQRVETWGTSHPVGYALTKLYQSIVDKTAYKFLFIRYEDLCKDPEPQIKSIYEYLEVPYYSHNYDYIPQITEENDTVHGIYGDHKIRNKLQALPNDSYEILGSHTYDWIYQAYPWFYEIFKYDK